MNNLHAPTVPSGPTSARLTNGGTAHLTFAELQRKKDNMEAELKALGGVLDSVRCTCLPTAPNSGLLIFLARCRYEHSSIDA